MKLGFYLEDVAGFLIHLAVKEMRGWRLERGEMDLAEGRTQNNTYAISAMKGLQIPMALQANYTSCNISGGKAFIASSNLQVFRGFK